MAGPELQALTVSSDLGGAKITAHLETVSNPADTHTHTKIHSKAYLEPAA